MPILLKNCAEIVISSDRKAKFGKELSTVETVKNQDVLVENGKIAKIGSHLDITANSEVDVIDW